MVRHHQHTVFKQQGTGKLKQDNALKIILQITKKKQAAF